MRKEKQGKVISDKMMSTVIVETVNLIAHPIYKKVIRKRSKFIAHNPDNKAKLGDEVRIIETRPLSKTKRWRVAEILKTHVVEAQPSKKKDTASEKKPKKVKKSAKSKKSSRKGKK
jgi:small subunit ribosomal protein S17